MNLEDFLASLAKGDSPLKVALGMGVLVLIQYLVKRFSKTPDGTPNPAPAPTPAPQPEPSEPLLKNPDGSPRFPRLNQLRELLRELPLKDIIPILLPLIMERKIPAPVVQFGTGKEWDKLITTAPAADPAEEELLRILAEQIAKSIKA